MQETFKELEATLLKETAIKVEKSSFHVDGKEHHACFYAHSGQEGKRPGIIVVPEWWGLNDYVKKRAAMMAALGYAALAIDLYGKGTTAGTPSKAIALTKPFYEDFSLAKKVIEAAMGHLESFSQVEPSRIAIVGFCFGGYVALSAGVAGMNVKAAVGFHASLGGVNPVKGAKAKILICHGGADEFEKSNVAPLKARLDSAGIDYTFKEYRGAKHAFTNPGADAKGKEAGIPIGYNEAADSKSWEEMKIFFEKNL